MFPLVNKIIKNLVLLCPHLREENADDTGIKNPLTPRTLAQR